MFVSNSCFNNMADAIVKVQKNVSKKGENTPSLAAVAEQSDNNKYHCHEAHALGKKTSAPATGKGKKPSRTPDLDSSSVFKYKESQPNINFTKVNLIYFFGILIEKILKFKLVAL